MSPNNFDDYSSQLTLCLPLLFLADDGRVPDIYESATASYAYELVLTRQLAHVFISPQLVKDY
eukprot:1599216-Pleurochrysis_carterae.AAC.1